MNTDQVRTVRVYKYRDGAARVRLAELSDIPVTDTYDLLREWHMRLVDNDELPKPYIFTEADGSRITDEEKIVAPNDVFVAPAP